LLIQFLLLNWSLAAIEREILLYMYDYVIACFTLVLGMTCITLFKLLSLPSCGLTTWLNYDFGFFLAPFTPPSSICLFHLHAHHALN
jgi:hypothetical protein